eukprot:TRINITY_DN5149_c1_g1_i3.p1 TRINITY_DN5149_c1_g1~~TRINITY_DN5149_c1_g1_i3.p1  ORF type:complete len:785 (-),score=144.10 TRINITY_DN5149_c1_g1_i3:227-2581(-)
MSHTSRSTSSEGKPKSSEESQPRLSSLVSDLQSSIRRRSIYVRESKKKKSLHSGQEKQSGSEAEENGCESGDVDHTLPEGAKTLAESSDGIKDNRSRSSPNFPRHSSVPEPLKKKPFVKEATDKQEEAPAGITEPNYLRVTSLSSKDPHPVNPERRKEWLSQLPVPSKRSTNSDNEGTKATRSFFRNTESTTDVPRHTNVTPREKEDMVMNLIKRQFPVIIEALQALQERVAVLESERIHHLTRIAHLEANALQLREELSISPRFAFNPPPLPKETKTEFSRVREIPNGGGVMVREVGEEQVTADTMTEESDDTENSHAYHKEGSDSLAPASRSRKISAPVVVTTKSGLCATNTTTTTSPSATTTTSTSSTPVNSGTTTPVGPGGQSSTPGTPPPVRVVHRSNSPVRAYTINRSSSNPEPNGCGSGRKIKQLKTGIQISKQISFMKANNHTPVILKENIPHGLVYEDGPHSLESDKTEAISTIFIPDDYEDLFYGRPHLNWLAIPSDKDHESLAIFSVSKHVSDVDTQLLLVNDCKGFLLYEIPNEGSVAKIEKYFKNHFPCFNFARLKGPQVEKNIQNIELKTRQEFAEFEISVIYSKEEEHNPHVMFETRETSPNFLTFLEHLGVDNPQDRVDINWEGKKVVFSLAPYMTSEDHRRFIGNCQAALFFVEGKKPFDPSSLLSMGALVQVFIVVRKTSEGYKVACMHRETISRFNPHVYDDAYLLTNELLDYLLIKFYNGYMAARTVPPICKLYDVPRHHWIQQIAKDTLQKQKKEPFRNPLLT